MWTAPDFERSPEIPVTYAARLFRGPLLNADSLYAAQIKNLQIMRIPLCLVRGGIEHIAWKIRTLAAECYPFVHGTFSG